jgi:hypothetical protein
MGNLRLYRDIYRLEFSSVTGETYTLIDVTSISASSFLRNSTAITETLSVFNESTGIYYVELNPVLYTFDNIYEVRWVVGYTSVAPLKTLTTRFKMKPFNIAGIAYVDVIDDDIIAEVNSNDIILEIEYEAQ